MKTMKVPVYLLEDLDVSGYYVPALLAKRPRRYCPERSVPYNDGKTTMKIANIVANVHRVDIVENNMTP